LFSTILTHADRSTVVIPNRKIVGEILHNYGHIRQVSVQVGVAPDTDVAAALQVIEAVVLANPQVLKDVPPVIGVSSLAQSVVQISVQPWVSVADYGAVTAGLSRMILEALRANRISLALTQHEVRLLQPQA
jgi:small conductance mechanosensitive channel